MSNDYSSMAEWELIENLEDRDATIEGLGQQNTEWEKAADSQHEAIVRLNALVEQHKVRYANAIKMIERRQEQLQLQRGAYKILASQYTELAQFHKDKVAQLLELSRSVRDLANVNTVDLDDAIDALANALDTALLG